MTIVESITKNVPAYEFEVARFGGPEWFNKGWYGALGALWELAHRAAKEKQLELVQQIFAYVELIIANEEDKYIVDAFSIEMIEPLFFMQEDPSLDFIARNLGPVSLIDLTVKREHRRNLLEGSN